MTEPARCPFCSLHPDDIIAKNALCYAILDRHPVSKGHMLVIPFRHVPDFFDLTADDRHALIDLVIACRDAIQKTLSPMGYNIGINVGHIAGQSVMHCHCHIIPRYPGDTDHPGEGIRCVVPHHKW